MYILREYDGKIVSILTSYEDAGEGMRQVAIRVILLDKGSVDDLTKILSDKFSLIFYSKDELDNLPRK